MMTGTVCFEQKSTICSAKFGDLGANGDRWSEHVIESAIFGIADPDLLIHYATTMMINGSLLLSAPIVKHFRSKKLSRFGPKFDSFWGINMGFKLHLSFITAKRHIKICLN